MATLELRDLSKIYNQHSDPIIGIEDINIDLDDGNFLVLVGPSGCGKSTTLRSIAGLEDVTEGEIRIGGRVVNNEGPPDRDIAMVFQNYALYPHMTARQNIGFGLKMQSDLSKEEIHERVENVAEMMGIGNLLEQKPGELSGGQQQRVALGRAIVREPSVFLLDEPLSNLDAKLRARMRKEIKELQQNLGITAVYVTHDQTEAMTMGDKVAILNEGKIQQLSTPIECYRQPANLFVAGFIGEPSMNFFETRLQGDRLINDELDYLLPDEMLSKIGQTEQITLGIRPEAAEIADSSGDHTIRGVVNVIEPLGSTNQLHIDTKNNEMIVEVPGDHYAKVDEEIIIQMPLDKIHLFDTKKGDTLHNPENRIESVNQPGVTDELDSSSMTSSSD